jgi:hypothetical protein
MSFCHENSIMNNLGPIRGFCRGSSGALRPKSRSFSRLTPSLQTGGAATPLSSSGGMPHPGPKRQNRFLCYVDNGLYMRAFPSMRERLMREWFRSGFPLRSRWQLATPEPTTPRRLHRSRSIAQPGRRYARPQVEPPAVRPAWKAADRPRCARSFTSAR